MDVNKLFEMNFGVFGVSDWSIPELNCAENMKIAKAITHFFLWVSPQHNNSDVKIHWELR